ncbi:MAG: transporter family carbohydrate exporter [Bacteriovoracaceae bacterium]|nr:transporter family carbohydrate exporter [Bacteriovoracaceae bacterium]
MRFYYRALSYFRQDSGLIILLLILTALITASGLLIAWPLAILVDSVLAPVPKSDWIHRVFLALLPENNKMMQIIGLALMGLLLKFAQDIFTSIRTLVNNEINYNGLLRVRCDLFKKLQSLSLGYHNSQPEGDSIFRLSTDTYGCQAILSVVVSTLVACLTLIAMICILLSRSTPLTLLALAVVPPLFFANVWFEKRLKRKSTRAKQVDSEFMTKVQRSISSMGLIQAFGQEKQDFEHFHKTATNNLKAWWHLNREEVLYTLTVGVIFGFGAAIIFGYGGYLVYQNQFVSPHTGGLTIGDLMIFLSYLTLLWDPICKLTGASTSMHSGRAGCERVFEVLDRDSAIVDSPNAVSLAQMPRTLKLNELSFGYQSNRPILKDLNLEIKPGEMVAFVGSSGVGKSTLINLLPRFYDPTSGSIHLDGHDMRDIKIADLRRHIALVLQENIILPASIAENIAYGRPSASLDEIKNAAVLAGAADFIETLPHGYFTQITERGHNLSGGQKQRISIARALLTEAPIIILDEPTSALDPHHESVITETLHALKGKRTIIVVSHRLSTILDADKIYMMMGGKIIESGTHDELLSQRGFYYAMARHQLKLDEGIFEFPNSSSPSISNA